MEANPAGCSNQDGEPVFNLAEPSIGLLPMAIDRRSEAGSGLLLVIDGRDQTARQTENDRRRFFCRKEA